MAKTFEINATETFDVNFDEFKTATAVKEAARTQAAELIREFFVGIVGEDRVSDVGINEIAVAIGTKTDKDGANVEVVVIIKPTAKDYEERKTTTKTFEAYDRDAEAEAFKVDREEKAANKAKAKAKAADKANSAKAEKLAKLNAKIAEIEGDEA